MESTLLVRELSDKKKQLKTLVTFHSEAVFDRATAEQNTSALIEALLARHFEIEIEGDSVQAQVRRVALGGVPDVAPDPDRGGLRVPISTKPVAPLPAAVDEIDESDGDLEDEAPLELPDIPASIQTADTGVVVPASKIEPELIPDRPAEQPVAPVAAFAPATPVESAAAPQDYETPVAAAPVEPAPEEPTMYEPGTRLCPTCGNSMGTDPYCLNCL